ncbi:CU044_5270 family protein [Streptomyces microflavus]|uniref:CU044_5270 family protein n=1 Tax=Streptomyces microflavus TaxID=1919 RepID=UPI00364CC75F
MNPQQQEQSEREQAGRTLPPPPAPEPAPGRVEARRVHFLSEIDRHTPARSYRPMLRPGKRWSLALGTAVAAAASIAVLSLGSGSPAAPAKVQPASAASVQLLERAALVAAAMPQTKVRAGQYTYIKTVGHTSALSETKTGEKALLRQDGGMEQWTSVDGSAQTLQRRNGSDALLPGTPGQGNLNSPTYNLLEGLPTDPEALLKHISDDAEENHGAGSESTTGPHQEAFVTIGDLLRTGGTPPPRHHCCSLPCRCSHSRSRHRPRRRGRSRPARGRCGQDTRRRTHRVDLRREHRPSSGRTHGPRGRQRLG